MFTHRFLRVRTVRISILVVFLPLRSVVRIMAAVALRRVCAGLRMALALIAGGWTTVVFVIAHDT